VFFGKGFWGINDNQITLCFGKGYKQCGIFFKGFWKIIGKQITLFFFCKGLAIEVDGLDAFPKQYDHRDIVVLIYLSKKLPLHPIVSIKSQASSNKRKFMIDCKL
jgi:hypothetical protein